MSLEDYYTQFAKVTSPIEFFFTEHNRGPVQVQFEQIENSQRTANGTLRKFVTAKKRTFQVGWTMLPSRKSLTIDGKSGAEQIKRFYDNYYGQKLTIQLNYHGAAVASTVSSLEPSGMTTENVDVFITSFSYEIQKRLNGPDGVGFDYVNLSIGFTEV